LLALAAELKYNKMKQINEEFKVFLSPVQSSPVGLFIITTKQFKQLQKYSLAK